MREGVGVSGATKSSDREDCLEGFRGRNSLVGEVERDWWDPLG